MLKALNNIKICVCKSNIRIYFACKKFKCNLTHIRMATLKKQNKTKISVGEDVEKLGPLYSVDGNIKWCSQYGKHYGSFSKI